MNLKVGDEVFLITKGDGIKYNPYDNNIDPYTGKVVSIASNISGTIIKVHVTWKDWGDYGDETYIYDINELGKKVTCTSEINGKDDKIEELESMINIVNDSVNDISDRLEKIETPNKSNKQLIKALKLIAMTNLMFYQKEVHER